MTGFRFFLCFCVLWFGCTVGFAAQEPSELEQENAQLQRQVKRLEAQVAALREELNSPDITEVFSGIGYIVGIFGVASWIALRKKNRQGS